MNAIEVQFAIPLDVKDIQSERSAATSQSPNMDAKVMTQSPAAKPNSPANGPETKTKPGERTWGVEKNMLEKQIEKLNEEYRNKNTSLSFSIDEETKSVIVKVVDTESDKVIRQIPPEEILAIRRRIEALLGALFDKEA